MSEYFKESNAETARELFEKRAMYDVETSSPLHTNLVDFNFAEKKLYGKVNRLYVPMVVAGSVLPVKDSPYKAHTGKEAAALNFVVDAFAALNEEFVGAAIRNSIDGGDKYLSKLAIYKGYRNPRRLYQEHLREYKKGIQAVLRQQKLRYLNFREFIGKLMPYLTGATRTIPFTFPAFVKSTNCPAIASGLVLEISDLEYDNDKDKYEKFYSSPNWEFYLNACAKHGFMVDQHIPWRLVADIGSAPMLSYAANYYVEDTDSVLALAYQEAHHRGYFTRFKNMLYDMYAENRVERFTGTTYVKGNSKIVTYAPAKYTRASLFRHYNDLYFLKIYCQIRFLEEETKFTENQKERLIEQTLELSNTNFSLALDTFEIILNKTFDYRGSLSYISNALQKISE
jgi:hypothetical protein